MVASPGPFQVRVTLKCTSPVPFATTTPVSAPSTRPNSTATSSGDIALVDHDIWVAYVRRRSVNFSEADDEDSRSPGNSRHRPPAPALPAGFHAAPTRTRATI